MTTVTDQSSPDNNEAHSYRARLRVRVVKPLNTSQDAFVISFCGKDTKVSALPSGPLNKAHWIVFNAVGFASEQDAYEFGGILKSSLELLGVATRFGIDTGNNTQTAWINAEAAWAMGLISRDHLPLPNTHGLSVHIDDPRNRFFDFQANVTLLTSVSVFTNCLHELGPRKITLPETSANSLRLMNQALMTSDHLAQIALALSSVEALSQDLSWSINQRTALKKFAEDTAELDACSLEERNELRDALIRSLHRISVRQGIKRLLNRLGLSDLNDEWERLYKLRSRIFHGSESMTEPEQATAARDVVTICGQIVLKFAETEGLFIPGIAASQYDSTKPPTIHTGVAAFANR